MACSLAEVEERIRAGAQQMLDALCIAADGELEVDALTTVLQIAFRERNRIDFAVNRVVGTLDSAAEQGVVGGEHTMGLPSHAWLAQALSISPGAAYAQVHVARNLHTLPSAAAAFEEGVLSGQHASVILRAVEQVGRGGGDTEEAESKLMAERGRSPRDLHRWGMSLLHRMAPSVMEAEEERRHRRRFVRMAEVFDGGYEIEGYLDPVAGATLKTALEAVLGPRASGDPRSANERRADGLHELAKRALDRGDLPVRGGQRPHLHVTAGVETLRGDPGAAAALLDWGFPISGRTLRRIAEDAEVTPIVVDEKGDPLRVGRRYRTATDKMRRALAERDRRCVWPGCDRPPEWTQAHHERPWELDGETNVDEMVLLCAPHHRKTREGWRLERLPDRRYIVHRPPRHGPLEEAGVRDPGPAPPA